MMMIIMRSYLPSLPYFLLTLACLPACLPHFNRIMSIPTVPTRYIPLYAQGT